MSLSTLASPRNSAGGAAMSSNSLAFPCSLPPEVCGAGIEVLNQLLADTITLCDLYRKHHWQVSGPAYYPLHLLFDRHYEGQMKLVDELVDRVKELGGIATGMAREVAAATLIPAYSMDQEEDSTIQIARLLDAHEIIVEESRVMARAATARGDYDTGELIHSRLIATHELQDIHLQAYLAQDTL